MAAAGEFILEGLWAHKRISRNEERGFFAERPKPAEPREPHQPSAAPPVQLAGEPLAQYAHVQVELKAVKYIRYTKYTGEPADGVDLQELVKRLSDFFLQSGFESQYYGISEMDPDKTMEALRQAILRALEEGDLLPDDLLEQLLDGTPTRRRSN